MQKRTTSLLNKIGYSSSSKKVNEGLDEHGRPQKWIHPAKDLLDGAVCYSAKILGSLEVSQAKGVELVKDTIKKLKISRQLQKSEAGHKGSKLRKVEILVNIDCLRVLDQKSRQMVVNRPLHRISYCADDHSDKRIFAFIAKDQETKKHNCYVFKCEKEAAELTLTLGQAFQMAYKRYLEKEKKQIHKNKDMVSLGKKIEEVKAENEQLREKLRKKEDHGVESVSTNPAGFSRKPEAITMESNVTVETPGLCFESDTFSINSSTDGTAEFQSTSNPFTFSPPPNPVDKTVCQTTDLFDMRFSSGSWAAPLGESFDATNSDLNDGSTSLFSVATILQDSPRAPDSLDPFSTMHEQQTTALFKHSLNIGGPTFSELSYDVSSTNRVTNSSLNNSSSNVFESDSSNAGPFSNNAQWQGDDVKPLANSSVTYGGSTSNPFSPFDTSGITSSSSQNICNFQNGNAFDQYLSSLVATRDLNDSGSSTIPTPFSNNASDLLSSNENTINFGSDSFSPENHSRENSFDLFSTKSIDIPIDSFESTSIVHQPQAEQNSIGTQSIVQTVRPRPTGISTTGQVLPPPPDKKTLRAISIQQQKPVNLTNISTPLPNESIQKQNPVTASNDFDSWKEGPIGHVSKAKTTMDIQARAPRLTTRSRSRTSGSQKVPDIMTSIMKASKSLEDLDGPPEPKEQTAYQQQDRPFVYQPDLNQNLDGASVADESYFKSYTKAGTLQQSYR